MNSENYATCVTETAELSRPRTEAKPWKEGLATVNQVRWSLGSGNANSRRSGRQAEAARVLVACAAIVPVDLLHLVEPCC